MKSSRKAAALTPINLTAEEDTSYDGIENVEGEGMESSEDFVENDSSPLVDRFSEKEEKQAGRAKTSLNFLKTSTECAVLKINATAKARTDLMAAKEVETTKKRKVLGFTNVSTILLYISLST